MISDIRVGLETLSLGLGFIAGYYVGKWDSRKSDLGIFREFGAGITGLVLDRMIPKDEDLPSDEEIIKRRNEWFAEPLTKIATERKRSGWFALAFLFLCFMVFFLAQLS